MFDFLSLAYPWIKALHIVSVISWMAALFYLPRLFVHHVEQADATGQMHATFSMMEYKLAQFIMRPAMMATWVFGLALVLTPGIVDWTMIWPWTKGASVIAMTVFHIWLTKQVKSIEQGQSTVTGRQFRLLNEVPTLLMIVIVFSVVVKF